MSERFADLVGQVDAAFVVDTTGSMSPFIEAARRHIRALAEEIAAAGALDLRHAVVEYRDHPPQEMSFVTRPHPFGNGDELQLVLEALVPAGGGDGPEAVLDGLTVAARLQWRPHADRLCFLVGDAPPHGAGESGDFWPQGCPCRATPNGVVELLAGSTIRLHAIALTDNPHTVRAFRELAEGTGGAFTLAPSDPGLAVRSTGATLSAASDMVSMSRAFMAAAEEVGSFDPDRVAPAMAMPKEAARGIAAYLRRRGILRGDR